MKAKGYKRPCGFCFLSKQYQFRSLFIDPAGIPVILATLWLVYPEALIRYDTEKGKIHFIPNGFLLHLTTFAQLSNTALEREL